MKTLNLRNLFLCLVITFAVACGWSAQRLCGCPADEVPHEPHTEVCDSFDNDADGLVDEDGVCPESCVPGNTQCSDCVDNDADGRIDHGTADGRTNDPQCDSPQDDCEAESCEEPGDDLGRYDCVTRDISTAMAWLRANGVPEGLRCDDQPCDSDDDGDLDYQGPTVIWLPTPHHMQVVWFDGRTVNQFLFVDAVDWTCVETGDGTPDDQDDDGDGWTEDDGDCDDRAPDNCPDCFEVCSDAFDNNCDGVVDETAAQDLDGDGFTHLEGDCNDDAPGMKPGGFEWDRTTDYDCDGQVTDQTDADRDGVCSSGGRDTDRNGQCDSDEPYVAGLGNGDCNDARADMSPELPEIGNFIDDDCDGGVDESCDGSCNGVYHLDADGVLDCVDDYAGFYEGAPFTECLP